MKLAAIRTKTLSAASPEALDAAIQDFTTTLQEEQAIALHFSVAPATATVSPVYAVLIEYTS